MGRRVSRVCLAVALGGALVACASAGEEGERLGVTTGALGSTSFAVAPILDERPDDAISSVVVELRGLAPRTSQRVVCSGILITPLLVLTAAHCIDGSTVFSPGGGSVTRPGLGPNAPVYAYSPRTGLTVVAAFRATNAITRLGVPMTPERLGDDLALVFLDRAKLRQEVEEERKSVDGSVDNSRLMWTTFLETRAQRPSFQPPPAAVDGNRYTFSVAVGVASTQVGARRVGIAPPGATLTRTTGGRWLTLDAESDRFWISVDTGDSGGPLFRLRSDGTRDPFGIVAAGGGDNDIPPNAVNVFADITRSEIIQWLDSNARETGRSDRWLSRHGKRGLWFGEVDYTGPCNAGRDRDCDHWYDEHDNCSAIYNPDQDDANDDGIGDACDACPLLPREGSGSGNCNATSERFHAIGAYNKKFTPDVCDPVPCPSSTIDPATTRIEKCVEIDPDPSGRRAKNCESRTIRDFLTTATLASHDTQGRHTIVFGVETSARFCQSCTDDARCNPVINCRAQDAIQDALLSAEEIPTTPWHRVTFGVPTRFQLEPERGATFRWNYGQTVATNQWFFKTDYADWLAQQPAPLIQVLDRAACEGMVAGTCLGGLFWLHADTQVGALERGQQLANHHFGWQPDVLKGYCLGPRALLFSENRAATAAAFVAGSLGGEVVLPISALSSIDINPLPESELVLPSAFGIVGALQRDGSLLALSDDGASPCRGSLLTDSVARALRFVSWVNASDRGTTSDAYGAVLAVTLSSDGRTLVNGLVEDDAGLVLATDTARYHDLFGEREGAPAPPPRFRYASTFSLTAGGVYIVGGEDVLTRAPLGDVWFRPLAGDWTQLSTGNETIGTPLAATYGFADDRLWVLDAVDDAAAPARERRRARLLRIDPAGGGAARVFYVPRKRPELTAFLSTEQDGSVLLALADTSRFSLLRLRATAKGVFASRVRSERGHLLRAPIIDENGYSFVVEDPIAGLRIIRKRTLSHVRCDDDTFEGSSSSQDRPPPAPCDASKLEGLF